MPNSQGPLEDFKFTWPIPTRFPVMALRLEQVDYPVLLEALSTYPMPERLKTAIPKRQALFLGGRFCALQLIQVWLPACDELPILDSGAPDWPPAFYGAITHTHDVIAATLAPKLASRGIGLDVENLMDQDLALKIGERISTSSERAWLEEVLAQTPEYDRAQIYSLIFSAKESFYKAIYPHVQRFLDFDTVELCALETSTGQFGLRLNQALADWPAGSVIHGQFFWDARHVFTWIALNHD